MIQQKPVEHQHDEVRRLPGRSPSRSARQRSVRSGHHAHSYVPSAMDSDMAMVTTGAMVASHDDRSLRC
jgi:hypothetical protein